MGLFNRKKEFKKEYLLAYCYSCGHSLAIDELVNGFLCPFCMKECKTRLWICPSCFSMNETSTDICKDCKKKYNK